MNIPTIKNAFVLCILAAALTMVSHAQEKPLMRTPTGLKYTIHKAMPNARKPVPGDMVELKMMYKTSRDSFLYDNRKTDQMFVHILEKPKYSADFNEALALLGTGDSATFLLKADSFFLTTLQEKKLPKYISKGSDLTFTVKVMSVTPNETYMKKQMQYMKDLDTQADRSRKAESEALKKYLESNHISIPQSSNGLYFISEREGNGPAPVDGNIVVVDYKSSLINGKSIDVSSQQGGPSEFKVGGHSVIKGLDEAVRMMKKGGKAKIIIPSYLGYNDNEVGEIPAFSTLIYELELLDIK